MIALIGAVATLYLAVIGVYYILLFIGKLLGFTFTNGEEE